MDLRDRVNILSPNDISLKNFKEKRKLATSFSKEIIYDYWLKTFLENHPDDNYSDKLP